MSKFIKKSIATLVLGLLFCGGSFAGEKVVGNLPPL
jgi:hypothetical protein